MKTEKIKNILFYYICFQKPWFFRGFTTLYGSDFYGIGILHHNITLLVKKNFCCTGLQKTWFFRDFPTLGGSDFYRTPRGDLDTPLFKKKEKIEKQDILAQERGGSP